MRYRLIALVAILVVTAGCAEVAMEVRVTGDGEIERMEMDVVLDQGTYSMIEGAASDEGFDSVAEFLADDMDDDGLSGLEAEDVEGEDDKMIARLTYTDVDVSAIDEVTIEETDDGTLRYVDTDVFDEAEEQGDDGMGGGMGGDQGISAMTYTVVMPGEIVDSNAEEVDGDTATWTMSESGDSEELYVESNVDESGGGSSMPGFGLGVGLLALAAGAVAAARRGN